MAKHEAIQLSMKADTFKTVATGYGWTFVTDEDGWLEFRPGDINDLVMVAEVSNGWIMEIQAVALEAPDGEPDTVLDELNLELAGTKNDPWMPGPKSIRELIEYQRLLKRREAAKMREAR